ncbi:AI-2E family transporter [Arthrobacter rhombi]|uniref:Putative integral membrane protein n=1 Tax=Arthrobacter rhombi TaxID=71253 RepID=A0A1R4F462_9MICC|nr:AI-2E family transporter [Arthrobacter rhombi]SJM50709.1 putative integral membrane protein [Arthrobacter rhombi]
MAAQQSNRKLQGPFGSGQGAADPWADALGRASIRSAQTLLVILLAVVLIWAATRVPLVLIPVLIALILASAIAPLVRWLIGHRWPPILAVLTCLVTIMAVMGGVVTGIVTLIQHQSAELASRAVDGVEQLHGFLVTGPFALSNQQINAAGDKLRGFLSSGTFSTEAISGLRVAGETVAGVVLVAVILFFFLKDGEKIRGFLIGFLPEGQRARAYLAAEHSAVVLGGYVRGTAMIAAIDGLIVGVALVILRVPLALPLGVFVFLGGFVPIIGATLAGTLAVLVALVSNGPVSALIVLAVLIGANQLEHHLLQPLLMGRVLHIHGLVILLALAAGAVLAGIVGALLAVPLTAVGWTVLKTWSQHAAEASDIVEAATGDPPADEHDTDSETT